jgi:hypothetical protein
MGDLDVNRKAILKWILEKQDGRMTTGLNDRIKANGGLL